MVEMTLEDLMGPAEDERHFRRTTGIGLIKGVPIWYAGIHPTTNQILYFSAWRGGTPGGVMSDDWNYSARPADIEQSLSKVRDTGEKAPVYTYVFLEFGDYQKGWKDRVVQLGLQKFREIGRGYQFPGVPIFPETKPPPQQTAPGTTPPPAPQPRPAPAKKSGCFIATAAYGTPQAPQIDVLRQFRDERLMTDPFGRACVKGYYTFSPPIANIVSMSETLRKAVRALIAPLVKGR